MPGQPDAALCFMNPLPHPQGMALFWSAGAERSGDTALAYPSKPLPPFAGQSPVDLLATRAGIPQGHRAESQSAACRAGACKAEGGPSLALCRRTLYSEPPPGGFFQLEFVHRPNSRSHRGLRLGGTPRPTFGAGSPRTDASAHEPPLPQAPPSILTILSSRQKKFRLCTPAILSVPLHRLTRNVPVSVASTSRASGGRS